MSLESSQIITLTIISAFLGISNSTFAQSQMILAPETSSAELNVINFEAEYDTMDTIIQQYSKTVIPTYSHIIKVPTVDRYFGQEEPDTVPKLFNSAFISPEGLFEEGTYSPDMRNFYFTRNNGKYKKRAFFVVEYANNSWGNESETDIEYPRYSKDGNTIYRGNKYREKTENGWSELKSMGPPFSDKHIMGISVSNQGTFYFDEFERPDTVGAISYSRLINGKFEPRQKMGKEINTGTWIAHPRIAPDESYLIWDVVRKDGYGQADIYISFRDKNGEWLPAINMGNRINTRLQESGASITPDGKFLFFSRGDWKVKDDGSKYWKSQMYWVSTQIIENLRP